MKNDLLGISEIHLMANIDEGKYVDIAHQIVPHPCELLELWCDIIELKSLVEVAYGPKQRHLTAKLPSLIINDGIDLEELFFSNTNFAIKLINTKKETWTLNVNIYSLMKKNGKFEVKVQGSW